MKYAELVKELEHLIAEIKYTCELDDEVNEYKLDNLVPLKLLNILNGIK